MGVDVTEIYSPPRVTKLAKQYGLQPGVAMDITTCDDTGQPWDFCCPKQRAKALRLVRQQQPLLLVGSPMCTAWSILQGLNAHRHDPGWLDNLRQQSRVHLEFCTKLYGEQVKHGRYFLHEHPASAASWKEGCILGIAMLPEVHRITSHMCQFGMKGPGGGPVYKPTGWMSNSPSILQELNRKCDNRHEHEHLI